MKKLILYLANTMLAILPVAVNSCSQPDGSDKIAGSTTYSASTPCTDIAKQLLEIPPGTPCEMMKWRLDLNEDVKDTKTGEYNFICLYGMPKQGTPDLMPGEGKIELSGKYSLSRGNAVSENAIVYELLTNTPGISLSFVRLDANTLHLLDRNGGLVVGSGAGSYTLSRNNSIPVTSKKTVSRKSQAAPLKYESEIVGVFEGKTPCHQVLINHNKVNASQCNRVKWQLTLYQDNQTHQPSRYVLKTVYVGTGDSAYTNTGKWITAHSSSAEGSSVYQLELDPEQHLYLALLKGDDNILFMIDDSDNIMAGNDKLSYTLNRVNKQPG